MIKQGTLHAYDIRLSTLEWLFLIGLFIFSFINSLTLLIFLFITLFLFLQKEVGALKILNLITLRSIINPGIASDIYIYQNLKWAILFLSAIYLIKSFFKLDSDTRSIIRKILYGVILFVAYNIFVALTFSSLPLVAIFKLLSYAIIFLGVIIGIAYTSKKIDWIKWMFIMYSLLILGSTPLIWSPLGYLRNGHAFQGLTNQPNMLGILLAMYLGILIVIYQMNKMKYKASIFIIFSSISMWMVILSKSRTAFITSIVLFVTFLVFIKIKKVMKIILVNLLAATSLCYLVVDQSVLVYLKEFLYKGQDSILFSRTEQMGELMLNFTRNPWFGNGFLVPVLPFRTLSFSSEYFVEPGNLIIAVLSFSGIVGFLIFLIYILMILLSNIKNFRFLCYLPIATLLISMGEMVFFSSNNIGIWCYMFLSMYVIYRGQAYTHA